MTKRLRIFHWTRARLLRDIQAGAILVIVGWAMPAVGAPSIFDEDWTPPKSISRPKPSLPTEPASSTRPAVPPVLVTPTPPGTGGVSNLPTVAQPASPTVSGSQTPTTRRAIPGKAEQARSRKLMQEVFATQLADRTPAGRKQLADQMLAEAVKFSTSNPTDEYVVLAGAVQLAKESASLKLCGKAADALADAFDIDELAVKVDAALELKYTSGSAIEVAENISGALELVDRLMAVEEFTTATKLCTALQTGAANNPALRTSVQTKAREAANLRAARDRIQPLLDKLKTTPDDPAANLVVGSYYCLFCNQWETGLPMLARGSNPTLKALALSELAGVDTAEKKVALGDGWWAEIDRQPPNLQPSLREHAAGWYQQALASTEVTGLNRARLEKRVSSVPTSARPVKPSGPPDDPAAKLKWIETVWQPTKSRVADLLPHMKRSATTAQLPAGVIELPRGAKVTSSDRARPPIAFRTILQASDQDVRLGYGAKQIIFNWEGNRNELRVDGGPPNGKHKGGAGRLPSGTWVGIELIVLPKEMIIFVDGNERYRVEADFSAVNDPFSIAAATQNNGTIRVASVTAVQP